MAEPVFMADSTDPGMQQAVKLARKTFRIFWRELSWEYRRIIPGLDMACVKAAFTDTSDLASADDVEQMWINEIQFDGKRIQGVLVNQPNWLQSVAQGDSVTIKPSELMDWMYAIGGNVYGGMTVNHMRSQMGRLGRRSHDSAWGLNFGDPKKIRFVPPEFIGETKPGFLAKLTGGGTTAQDPAKVAATEHPMAINMVESLKEFAQDKDNLTMTDDNGLTILHQNCLAGAARGVNVLLKCGADGRAKTANGMTPFRLARVLGWKGVLKVLEKHGITE